MQVPWNRAAWRVIRPWRSVELSMARSWRVELFGNAAPTGGKLHPTLNTGERPIANKYREGKMKSTLERGLKVCEIAKGEALPASAVSCRSGAPLGCCTVQSTGPHELSLSDDRQGR